MRIPVELKQKRQVNDLFSRTCPFRTIDVATQLFLTPSP